MRETYSCGGPRRDGNRYRLLERERHTLQRLRQLRTCRRCCRETPTQYARQSSRGSVVFLRRSSSSSSSSSSCRLRIRRPPEQISSIIIISRERDPSSSCADHHHRHRLGERGIHSLLAQIVVIIIIILPGNDLKNTLALKDLNFRSYPKCSSISKGLLIYGQKDSVGKCRHASQIQSCNNNP
ncbi:hypothetical protein CY35_17G080500 [Sphagnum magellanicum]|nr:hypothetical protein CY35_17G080500 [Sphagnum magellanicum]